MTSTDLDDRRAQLDAFAAQPPREHNLPVAACTFSAPAERVFGAQQVAVHRDEARILQRLKVLAAAAGENWYYRYPVKNKRKGTTDWIEGPSIKLANDLARLYGNSDIDVRVLDLGESWLIYARFLDLETGFSLTRPFQQQKGAGKIGGDDDSRRLDTAFQIGVSKAIRNVVVNGLQTFADFAFEEARDALVIRVSGKLSEYRARVLQRLEELKIDARRAELVIGRTAEDWLAPDVAKLIAMIKAIADGMANANDTFPTVEKQPADDHDPETGEITHESEVMQHTSGGPIHADHNATPRQPEASTAAGGADGTDENEKSSAGAKQDPLRAAEAMTEGLSGIDRGRDHNRSGLAARTGGATPPTGATAAAGGVSKAAKAADHRSEGEYVAHAETWIGALTDGAGGVDRWKREKPLRNHCNVSPDVRDKLERALQEKIAEIKQKHESADLARHDQDIAEAAKSGTCALDAAIAKIPEPHKTTLQVAIERRHRQVARAVDAARERSAAKQSDDRSA